MAAPTRTIRIKFDGTAKGLERAAKNAARAIDKFGDDVERKSGGFGARIGVKLGDGVMSALATLPVSPQLALIGAGIGAAMAPALGAAAVAGVLLAVGGGVLAAGIFAAAKDPAVSAAWAAFGDRAKTALAGFAEPFKAPMIRAADTFGDAVERMAPTVKQLATSFAPLIDKLAPALASMAERAMPGIAKAAEASKPLFDVLAAHAPKIGDAISKFFGAIAAGGPGATEFLDMTLTFLEGVLPAIGLLFGGLSALFLHMKKNWDLLVAGFQKGWDLVKGAAKAAKDFVVDRWNELVGFVTGLPGRISSAASGMWDGIKNAFRGAINWIIDRWNGLSFSLPSVNVPGLGSIGGATLNTPDLPRLARGGPAAAGRAYLVGERGPEILQMGSRSGTVVPNHAIGGPDVLELHLDLGRGIQQVVQINLREHNRGLKRRATAGAGAR